MLAHRRPARLATLVLCATFSLSLSSCRLVDHASGQNRTVRSRTPAPHPVAVPAPAPALTQLNRLRVVSRRPFIPGYDRSCEHGAACVFGEAWAANPQNDGCSTRRDLLKSVMSHAVLAHGSKCTVASGRLLDPYSGITINFRSDNPDAVEVDHVLPLVTSWALGAAHWTQLQRVRFANDSSIELVPVGRASNQAKGDSGPAQYQPKTRKCAYDARFVAILTKYRLPVIAADKTAMTAVLRSCS